MIVKVALVTLGLVLTVAALPHNLDWKYGKAPKNALEANLRAYAWKTKTGAPMDTVVDCLQKDPDFSALVQFATKAGLVQALSNPSATLTVFAPTNDAFQMLPPAVRERLQNNPKLLAQVILGHALGTEVMAAQLKDNERLPTLEANKANIHISFGKDMSVFADEGKVTGADACKAGNGVVHKIDRVILHGNRTIVEEAITVPELSTLVAAVKAAGLVDALNNTDTSLTVFAPMNSAFQKVQKVVNCLLEPANKEYLVKVLEYHVAPKVYFARDLVTYQSITSLEGSTITVTASGNEVMVQSAKVVMADVPVLNGVVHLIDGVILPKEDILGPCK